MKRYSKQILVNEIGLLGQQAISEAHILIVGVGGLGVTLAVTLAGMGIGHLGIVDFDEVELTNLHRQFVYKETDIGRKKTSVLSEFLQNQNPDCKVTVYPEAFTGEFAGSMLADYQIVCDCTDNLTARLAIDNACFQFSKPLVYAAVKDWEGYVSLLNHKNKVRLLDLFPSIADPDEQIGSCSISGIVPSTCGTVANIQATEVLKLILELPVQLDGAVLCINGLTNTSLILRLNNLLTNK